MIEFGKTLREAREAKGYSVSQLADVTHILSQIIEDLEREDFTKIVAPIYGRGFVKLYCEHVGIEAKPLVDEFMDIYNGNRPPVIRLKDAEDASVAAPVEETPPVLEPPAPEPLIPEPPAPEPPAPEPFAAEPPPPAAPFTPGPDDLPFRDETSAPRRDYRMPGYAIPDVPRSFWRFGVLVIAAVAVIALLVIGSRALYRATMTVPEEEVEEVVKGEKVTPQASDPAPKAAQPRKPIAVPPLYID